MTIIPAVIKDRSVRTWFTLLALACFLPQQFTCCVESCGTCAQPVDAHGEESVCDHHEDHDHDLPDPGHDHSSHHLCVATHLFYVTTSNMSLWSPDMSLNHAVPPVLDAAVDQQLTSPSAVIAWLSARSPAPQRLRAVLGVWVI
ncbi:MAG: hypothetical protein SFV23_07950 [Planctomycetaceae bacterium]|nr:hypothetical protein [Planctomycetaceae bacterium]